MPSGTEVKVALKQSTTWGTAISVNEAGRGIFLTGWTGRNARVGDLVPDPSFGSSFVADVETGNVDLAGQFNAIGRYDTGLLLLALCMGAAATPVQQATTTAYLHVLSVTNSIDGKMATFVADLVTHLIEFVSVKVHGVTITMETGQYPQFAFDYIAHSVRFSNDTVNPPTNTTIASATIPTDRPPMFGRHMKIRTNRIGDAALSDSNRILPGRVVFRFQRPMSGDHLFDGQDVVDEPSPTDQPRTSVELLFPVHRSPSATLVVDAGNAVEYKMDITFTSPLLAGTGFPYQFRIDIPRLRWGAPDIPVNGLGKIPCTLTAEALDPASASPGMTTLQPFEVSIINKNTTVIMT